MLTYNTMRFGTDTFNIIEDARTALLIAKNPIITDFDYTHITQFIIDYDQPAGTQIAFAFTTDAEGNANKIFKLVDNHPDDPNLGRIAVEHIINPDSWLGVGAYTTDDITADIILEKGSSVADLTALNGMELVPGNIDSNRRLRPIIALRTTKTAVPKVKFGLEVAQIVSELDKEKIITRTYDEPTKFVAIVPTITEQTGNAAITLSAACKTSADGDWSDFGDLNSVTDKSVYGVKIKGDMHVTKTNGSDKIKCKVKYSRTDDVECNAFGDFADIYSITRNYFLPLKYCVVVVKHAELLSGAKIKAYAKFDPSINWKVYTIGTGTGSFQNYNLPVNAFIDVNNLHVYVNGVETTDYRLYVKDNYINIKADSGATITASSNYNLKTEEWIELDADAAQHDVSDGKFTTRFSSKITKSGVYVSAIRLRLFRGTANPDNVITLPITPTGEEQTYRFSQSDIELVYFHVLNSNGDILYNSQFNENSGVNSLDCECSFNQKYSVLTFTVPAGDYTLEACYRKKAEVPRVYSWTAGYCV